MFQHIGDIRSRAITMGQIADVLQARGETDEALRIRREEELPVYDRLGDIRSRAVTLQKIAVALLERGGLDGGEVQEILSALTEAFASFRRLGQPDGVAFVGLQLAQILAAFSMKPQALGVLDEAEAAFGKLGHAEGAEAARRLRAQIQEVHQ